MRVATACTSSVVAMLSVSAYLQGKGLSLLVADALFPMTERQVVPPATEDQEPVASTRPTRPRSARAILERNPFDSVTGPLLARTLPKAPAAADAANAMNDPLKAKLCTLTTLTIVTESAVDPMSSVAQLRGPDDQLAVARAVGDLVGDLRVAYIGFNYLKASPAVWLQNERELCQVILFGDDPKQRPTSNPVMRQEQTSDPQPNFQDRIQKLADDEFRVDRSLVQDVLEKQDQLMRQVRVVPDRQDGRVLGIRLFGVREGSLLGNLGLKNGDRLESINGLELADPEKALTAFVTLRSASQLRVQLTRQGKPVSIHLDIQ